MQDPPFAEWIDSDKKNDDIHPGPIGEWPTPPVRVKTQKELRQEQREREKKEQENFEYCCCTIVWIVVLYIGIVLLIRLLFDVKVKLACFHDVNCSIF